MRDFAFGHVDKGDMIAFAQADKGALAVARHGDAHGSNVGGFRAFDGELHHANHGHILGGDDAHARPQLIRHPKLSTIRRERKTSGSLAGRDVFNHFCRSHINHMHHAGHLGADVYGFAVSRHLHTFRLLAHLDGFGHFLGRDVDKTHFTLVFVRDVKRFAIGRDVKGFGLVAQRDAAH